MKKLIPAVLAVAILAAGCILPNKYQATVTVDKDACQVDYKGQFLVIAAMDKRVPPEKAKAMAIDFMKRLEADILKQNGTITTKLAEPGVFEATLSYKQPIGTSPTNVLQLFRIKSDEQGKVTIKTLETSEGDKKAFPEAGIESKGELTIKTKGQVVEENAQDKPNWLTKWFSDGYTWKQDLLKSPQASMVIQF